ncbi:LysR family transcriptional regulator [Rossellomorea vietnamensis]|uniref:LysR family transcriptional regulator n=1 Tax=Rossellomorea vietnamensis TaxID=218284 RepID=A0A5D4MCX4_9BACI|nr:LysR family transcriptional regulator [Rossellomorea vietnamensis]TYR99789.1 LysR family transcriptional regulator [Rossellomorea vietnamensis]
MNIDQLEHVIEVANTGSLTKAAENLHVSLSAISQSISKLEKELGIQLFIRNRNGAVPTFEGKGIIEKAVETLVKVNELKEEADKYSDSLAGELKIGIIPSPTNFLIDIVSTFKSDYPNVKIEIYEKGPMEILEDIHHHRLDIGLILTSQTLLEEDHTLRCEPLLEGRMVAAVNKNSPLAKMETISPSDLIANTLVLYNDDYIKSFTEDILSGYGKIDIMFTSNNLDAIKRAVQKGMAVTVGLDYSFNSHQPFQTGDIVSVPIKGPRDERVYFTLVRKEGKVPSRTVKEFMKRTRRAF